MQAANVTDFFSPEVDLNTCIGFLQNLREQIKQAQTALTNEDLLVLLTNAGHIHSYVREECLLLIAQSSRPLGRLAALSRLLDDSDLVRVCALELLEECGEVGDQYAVEWMLEMDPEWIVRASAASCLAGIAGSKAKAAVVRALEDADPDVRRYAASALARIADATDMPTLLRAEARETVPAARTGIYAALYQLGHYPYLDKLIALISIDASDPELVNVSCQALSALDEYVFPGDVPFVRARLAALDTTTAHPAVRSRILRLLDALAKPE